MAEAASSMLWMLAARAPNSCIAISCPTNTASASSVPYLGSRRNEYFGIGRLKRCPRLDGYSRMWSVLACDWCLGRLSPPNRSSITSAILARMPRWLITRSISRIDGYGTWPALHLVYTHLEYLEYSDYTLFYDYTNIQPLRLCGAPEPEV